MDFSGPGVFPQIVIALIISTAIFISYAVAYQLQSTYKGYSNTRVTLMEDTMNVGCGGCANQSVLCANPCNPACSVLPLSENQLTGIEFSYTTFLYIQPPSTDADGWNTVFYKGYSTSPFPLCGPGVFVTGANNLNATPTLRVVMNTYDGWFNKIEVNQVPMNKWLHLAIVLRKNALEIYINGNLANRHSFNGTLPYQNYEGITIGGTSAQALPSPHFDNTEGREIQMGLLPGEEMVVSGPMSGFMSRFYYFSYALTYSEIMGLMNMGPSSTMHTCNNMDKPPYLIDSWWTQRKN